MGYLGRIEKEGGWGCWVEGDERKAYPDGLEHRAQPREVGDAATEGVDGGL